jgi:hypothetical protein
MTCSSSDGPSSLINFCSLRRALSRTLRTVRLPLTALMYSARHAQLPGKKLLRYLSTSLRCYSWLGAALLGCVAYSTPFYYLQDKIPLSSESCLSDWENMILFVSDQRELFRKLRRSVSSGILSHVKTPKLDPAQVSCSRVVTAALQLLLLSCS